MRVSFVRSLFALVVCATVLGLAVAPANTASSQSKGATMHLIDKSVVADPACQQALAQIETSLAGINDYSCQMKITSHAGAENVIVRNEQYFKRPNLFLNIARQEGCETRAVCDGSWYWQYVVNAPGSGRAALKKMNLLDKMPPEQVELFVKNHETPQVFKTNLLTLDMQGCSAMDIFGYGRLLRPFADCDMATVAIESAEGDAWGFAFKVAGELPNMASAKLTVGQKDGILKTIVYSDAGGAESSKVEVFDVRTNEGLTADRFVFTPPVGVAIIDNTDDMVAAHKPVGEAAAQPRLILKPTPGATKGKGIVAPPAAPAAADGDKPKAEGGDRGGGDQPKGGGGNKGGGGAKGGDKGKKRK